MKRSTGYWSTAVAAAALIALPASGFAQPPASTPSQQPPTQTPTSQSTGSQPQTPDTATSPADHVREAKQALSSIPQSSIPAGDRAQFAQLRTHLNNLEREAVSSPSASSASPSSARRGTRSAAGTKSWATDVSAIDSILTKLIGNDTGSSAPAEAAGTSGRAPSSSALDATTADKLREVRKHVTAFAASMSGTSGESRSDATGAAAAASADTMGSTSSSSSQASPTPAEPTSSATSSSSSSPTTGTEQQAGTQATGAGTQTSTAGAPQVDAAAAKQHLSEARDSLSQLTTLPEAAKLQGEARTQISQLISNFNELITTETNWRDAYNKVEANLATLLGPDTSESAATGAMPSATGTTGTTGTTGSTAGTTGAAGATAPAAGAVQIDPAIRAKLVEFRTHLKEFEQAAGGNAQASPSSSVNTAPAANPATPVPASGSPQPSAMPPATATASTSNPANPTSTTPGSPASASSAATGTAGAVGTSGSAASAPSATDAQAKASEAAGHAQADKELDAIQAILDKAKKGQLDKSDTDQLKAHVAQLRQLLAQSGSGK